MPRTRPAWVLITGGASGLSVSWPRQTQLALVLHNNRRNLQIPIADLADGFGVKVTWAAAGATRK